MNDMIRTKGGIGSFSHDQSEGSLRGAEKPDSGFLTQQKQNYRDIFNAHADIYA